MHNHSYENEFNLHVNEISFSYEKMRTKTRFEEEAKGNSEMAYYRIGAINSGNVFSHITLKKAVCDFPDVVLFVFFFYNLLKFDIVYADVPLYKRGHNSETEAKLNKARHPFSNKVSLTMAADFQLIPSEDTRKGTKNVHPYRQFYVIERKTKNVL